MNAWPSVEIGVRAQGIFPLAILYNYWVTVYSIYKRELHISKSCNILMGETINSIYTCYQVFDLRWCIVAYE